MRWKKILLIFFLLIVILITVVYAILSTYDFNKFKPRIIQAVREATGRELTLGGDLKVKLGLAPRLSIETVSFQNADWGSQPKLASFKHLEVQVALLPLIRGRIEFERFILVEPNFLLEFSQSGESNLDFHVSEGQGGMPPTLIFNELEIDRGTFTYKDDELGKTYTLILDRLAFNFPESKQPNELEIKGTFNGKPFEMGGFLDQLALLTNSGEDWPIKLTTKFGQSEVIIEGDIKDLSKGEGLQFSISAKSKSTLDITKIAGLKEFPDFGPFKFATNITGSFSRLTVEDLDFHVGTDELVDVKINGNIKDLLAHQGVDLNFTARCDDFADLEKVIGQSLPISGDFSISGKLHDEASGIYKLTNLKAKLGVSDIGGSIDIDPTAQRPKVSTILSSQQIDLRPFLSEIAKKESQTKESFEDKTKEKENMPEEIRAQDVLTAADIDFKVHVKNIILPQLKFDDLATEVILKDGHITVRAQGSSPPDISELTGVKGVPDLGLFKLAFHVADPIEKLSIEKLIFSTGVPELVELKLTGSIKEPLAQRGIRLDFSMQGKDVAKLEKFFGQPLPIQGAFSVFGQVIDSAANIYQLRNLGVVLGDNKIAGSANFNLADQKPRISVTLSSQNFNLRPLSLPNIEKIVGLTNAADLGPFKLQLEIADPAGQLAIEKLDFFAGIPNLVEIKIDGFIKDLLALQEIELNFSARGKEAAGLEKLVGRPLPIQGAFSASGQVIDSKAKVYNIKNFEFFLSDSDIKGQLHLNLTSQRPQITAELSSKIIDLGPLALHHDQKISMAEVPAKIEINKLSTLPEAPLTPGFLKIADADVRIRIDQIRLHHLALNDLTIEMVLQDGQMTLTADSQSIPDMTELTGVAGLPNLGPVKLVINASGLKDKLVVEKFDFHAGTGDMVEVTLKGTAKDLLTQQGIALKIAIKGYDCKYLEKFVGQQMPYKGSFIISGRVDDPVRKIYKFSALKIKLGDNDINGWLDINLAGKRPRVTAELLSRRLDLRWLLLKNGAQDTGNDASLKSGNKRDKVFPDDPLPLNTLKVANAAIKIRAKEILFPHLVISNFIADIMLEDGHLAAKPIQFSAGDGSIKGYFDLQPVGETMVLETDLKINQFLFRSTLQEMEDHQIFEGIIDGKIKIHSQFDSLAALMAGLNGRITFIHRGGRIANRYFGLFFGNLTAEIVERINVFRQKQKYTEVNCFVSHNDIKDGLAESVFLLDTLQTRFIGAGKVNLKTENLDLEFKSSPKKGIKIPVLGRVNWSLAELTKPFKVGGTLASPSVIIVPSRTAITLGKLTGGLMLGPVGLAVVFADVSSKDVDPCQQAINALEEENEAIIKSEPAATKQLLEKTTEMVFEGTKGAMGKTKQTFNKLFGK